jgi:hypothetical protein
VRELAPLAICAGSGVPKLKTHFGPFGRHGMREGRARKPTAGQIESYHSKLLIRFVAMAFNDALCGIRSLAGNEIWSSAQEQTYAEVGRYETRQDAGNGNQGALSLTIR